MPVLLVLSCLAIPALSIAGGVVPLLGRMSHARLQLYLSFAAGVMLGAAFFHMLPEAAESVPSPPRHPEFWAWMVLGLLSLFFLERFFAYHHHEAIVPDGGDQPHDTQPDHHHHGPDHIRPAHGGHVQPASDRLIDWWTVAIGLTVHSLTEGFALGSVAAVKGSASDNTRALFGVFLAILLHKPADSLTVISLMVRGGSTRLKAHTINVIYSLAVPLGVVLFRASQRVAVASGAKASTFGGKVLAFSAGTFLCIALADLLPELQFHAHDRWKLSIALLGGLGLMYVTALFV